MHNTLEESFLTEAQPSDPIWDNWDDVTSAFEVDEFETFELEATVGAPYALAAFISHHYRFDL